MDIDPAPKGEAVRRHLHLAARGIVSAPPPDLFDVRPQPTPHRLRGALLVAAAVLAVAGLVAPLALLGRGSQMQPVHPTPGLLDVVGTWRIATIGQALGEDHLGSTPVTITFEDHTRWTATTGNESYEGSYAEQTDGLELTQVRVDGALRYPGSAVDLGPLLADGVRARADANGQLVLRDATGAVVGELIRDKAVPAPASATETWIVPIGDQRSQFAISQRTGDRARPPTRIGTSLGDSAAVPVVDAGAGGNAVAWFGVGGRTQLRFTDGSADQVALGSEIPDAALSTPDGLMVQQGQHLTTLTSGKPTIHTRLPVVPIGPIPAYFKGAIPSQPDATVAGIATTTSGHLVVALSGFFSAEVADLTTGQTLELDPAGIASSATGTDGLLYLLMRPPTNDGPFVLEVVDPDTLTVTRMLRTDLPAPASYLHTQLVPTASGIVAAVSTTGEGEGSSVTLSLQTLIASGLTPVVTLPPNSGLTISAASGGDVYLFGGPAQNLVSLLDPTTGAFTQLPELRAPTGAYVVAVQ